MKNLDEKTLQSAKKTRFPSPIRKTQSHLSEEERIAQIADHFQSIMELLNLDLSDDSLSRTPLRVAKMYVKEIFSGLDEETFPNVSFIEDKFTCSDNKDIIFLKMSLTSFCEHHFVPMSGHAYIAYCPNKKLIGLSKIPRIVRFFAKRPQVQERLTAQIVDCLSLLLDTSDVAVSIVAQHFCVIARGIENESSLTTTNVLRGCFETETEMRQQFFEAVNRKS